MRFGAIFTAVLSLGVFAAAAPTQNARQADVALGVGRSLVVDRAPAEVAVPIARFAEEKRAATAAAAAASAGDLITTLQTSQATIQSMVNDIQTLINQKAPQSDFAPKIGALNAELANLLSTLLASVGLLVGDVLKDVAPILAAVLALLSPIYDILHALGVDVSGLLAAVNNLLNGLAGVQGLLALVNSLLAGVVGTLVTLLAGLLNGLL